MRADPKDWPHKSNNNCDQNFVAVFETYLQVTAKGYYRYVQHLSAPQLVHIGLVGVLLLESTTT